MKSLLSNKITPYYKYFQQIFNCERQINWWNQELKDNWFYKFIKFRINENIKPFELISLFGPISITKFKSSRKKIFFSGENLFRPEYLPYLNNISDYDLFMSFSTNYLNNNYLRFPLWNLYLFDPKINDSEVKLKLDAISNLRTNKSGNACMVASWCPNGVRTNIFTAISKVSYVDSAGKLLNNSNLLHNKYSNNKIEYLKNFKFNICPENSDANGYVTEKIFQAYMSDCIPIYWGGGDFIEPNILNPNSFIYWNPNAKNEESLNLIVDLINCDKKYRDFKKNNHIFVDGAAEYINKNLAQLESRLRSILL